MTFFSKLFKSPVRREFEALLANIRKETEEKLSPVNDIGRAILRAATTCRDSIKDLIEAPNEHKRMEREILVFYEFVYFYMHMTMRRAFSQLPAPAIRELQTYLGPLVACVAIDSYFAHWPADLKGRMVNDFYDKVNQAEIEYAQATNLDSSEEGDERTKVLMHALFMKVAENVADASGNGKDFSVILPAFGVAASQWMSMDLAIPVARLKQGARTNPGND